MKSNKKSPTYTKKQWALFITGLIALFVGMSIIDFYGVRKIYREIQKQKLLRDNPVVEITELNSLISTVEHIDELYASVHIVGDSRVAVV